MHQSIRYEVHTGREGLVVSFAGGTMSLATGCDTVSVVVGCYAGEDPDEAAYLGKVDGQAVILGYVEPEDARNPMRRPEAVAVTDGEHLIFESFEEDEDGLLTSETFYFLSRRGGIDLMAEMALSAAAENKREAASDASRVLVRQRPREMEI